MNITNLLRYKVTADIVKVNGTPHATLTAMPMPTTGEWCKWPDVYEWALDAISQIEALKNQNGDLERRNTDLFIAAQRWEQRCMEAENELTRVNCMRSIEEVVDEAFNVTTTNNELLRAQVATLTEQLHKDN